MDVVLFCGGLDTRVRGHSETVPRRLVNVGERPIIWHLMRYDADTGTVPADSCCRAETRSSG